MKINKDILSLPPYISTSWNNVISLYIETSNLIVILKNGSKVEIPNLDANLVKIIFDAYEQHLENQSKPPKTSISFGIPFLGEIDSLSTALQHNPKQKDAPDIPIEIIQKISHMAKLFVEETNMEMPKPEQNCNCLHCQIAKALQVGLGINLENLDEDVDDKDLKFRTWDIKEENNKLYTVINPLDKNEHYSVFLGEPIGCTCGNKNCEHIKAVLNS